MAPLPLVALLPRTPTIAASREIQKWGCRSEKTLPPDFIPLNRNDLRSEFSFFTEQVALVQREKSSCRLSVAGCRWRAGKRESLASSASSAPSAVKEPAMHHVNPGFQKRGGRLQEKEKCFSQTPATPRLATGIFIFRAKNCHRVGGQHGSCQLSVVGCRWTAGKRESPASSASSVVGEPCQRRVVCDRG